MTQANLKNNPSSSLLKETRLAKGLTLDIVHESTKIPMDAIRAIEEGYTTRILTPFYYRGFIKIYAEFLGLNIADVLKEYNVLPSATKTALPLISSKAKAKAKDSKGSSVAAEQFQEFFTQVWTAQTKRNLLRTIAAVIVIVVLVKIVGCVVSVIKNSPKKPKVNVVVKETKKQTPTKNEQSQEDSSMIAAVSQNHKVTLAVRAPKDIWISVKTDGQVAFQMTMKKGTMESWEAKDEIELAGKNINELDVEVNGKDVNLSDSSNRRARKVLITKDGLTVKR